MKYEDKSKEIFHIRHWQLVTIYLALYDIVTIAGSYMIALWLRFDCKYNDVDPIYVSAYLKFIPIYCVFCVIIFGLFNLYRTIWRFASYNELARMILATVITGLFHIVAITMLFQRMPLLYYFGGLVLQFVFTIGIRFSYRFVLLMRGRIGADSISHKEKNVMLIGAGNAGQMILRDIKHAKETRENIACIIDDNPNKWGRYIDGVIVEGGRDEILAAVEKYQIKKIYVAIPSATMQDKREILNVCAETRCEIKSLPGIYQFRTGEVSVSSMKEVQIEDLLGREPIEVDTARALQMLEDKSVLVTGGGGSIGSELCRQIASHHPKRLVIFDIYENNAYEIQQELKKKYPQLNLVVLIGSVRDSRRLDQVFSTYRPDVVFHAAAHKHVPLMEDSPCESIKNNVIGTYKTAYAAMRYGVKRFVLISTDKAVNPTNIMGASKRLCEMVVQTFDEAIKQGFSEKLPFLAEHDNAQSDLAKIDGVDKPVTEFVAVRFGNVLGSNGSVIPLFKKQIAAGGPVTVTHPDIIRYFMTIPEAVSLVLQAGTYAEGGEIFVLDMGEPVKIDTLARNLIKLSGFKPDEDIRIEYTGLRPGEKLFEEKLMAEEGLKTTPNKLIHIGCPIDFDKRAFIDHLKELERICYANDETIRDYVKEVVSTYHPAEN